MHQKLAWETTKDHHSPLISIGNQSASAETHAWSENAVPSSVIIRLDVHKISHLFLICSDGSFT